MRVELLKSNRDFKITVSRKAPRYEKRLQFEMSWQPLRSGTAAPHPQGQPAADFG